MRFNTLCAVGLVCTIVGLSYAEAQEAPAVYEVDQVFGPELAVRGDREKKAIEFKLAKGFGVKNFLLDLIFGKVNQVIDYKTRLVSNLDRTNRYKNYYLLGLGTRPKGVAGGAGGVSGQVSASTSVTTGVAEPRGILTNAGGLGSAFGALTGLLGGLNVGVNVGTS